MTALRMPVDDPIAELIARLVAAAPRFTPAKIARLSMIMGSPLAAPDVESDKAAARASNGQSG